MMPGSVTGGEQMHANENRQPPKNGRCGSNSNPTVVNREHEDFRGPTEDQDKPPYKLTSKMP